MDRVEEIRTRLPTSLDDEDPFLSISEIKLSLRQMLTIVLGFLIWWLLQSATVAILPISPFFGYLLWSWILLGALFMAIIKKDGRPYEEYLSKKIVFLLSDRYFILKDPKSKSGSIDDANWDDLEDPYGLNLG